MNKGRWIVASLVIMVVDQILGWIIHSWMLSGMYQATVQLWRPMQEMTSMMWMMWISTLVWAFIFVYVFAKGYEGKGLLEGVRFGLLMGVFFGLPMSIGTFVSQPIGANLAFSWFFSTVIVMTIHGILAALIYKPEMKAVPQT
ncbi:MAG: hypothetical protein P8Y60_13625 [Calditrichota bacterium]|jgi:hypothetical protein